MLAPLNKVPCSRDRIDGLTILVVETWGGVIVVVEDIDDNVKGGTVMRDVDVEIDVTDEGVDVDTIFTGMTVVGTEVP